MPANDVIDDLLLHWEELRQQGQALTAEDLCRDHPDLVELVRNRIRVLESMDRLRVPAADAVTIGAGGGEVIGPPRLAGYEVLEEIGRGGMGVVYKARQVGLNRLVALKMILSGPHAGEAERSRFRAEAEAVARLQHPNIVHIYEVGEQTGRPFLSLEFVDGLSLDRVLKGQPQPPKFAAHIVKTLADAVQFAHEHGIVHRDLKPANILLQMRNAECGMRNEDPDSAFRIPHSAFPKISDFGLAKRLDTQTGLTQTGAVLGTPSYMAPEQAQGQSQAIGPATDVYSLGAILYEMLTGRPPFQGTTLLDTLDQVRSHDPVPPRLLQPAVPRDLEAICLKCLQKEPDRRYLSARALDEDLHRFVNGEAVQARGLSVVEYFARLINRNPDVSPIGDVWSAWLVYAAPFPLLIQLVFYLLAGRSSFYPLASLGVSVLIAVSLVTLVVVSRAEKFLGMSNAANRQLWSTRIGHLLGMLLMPLVSYLITPAGLPWNPLTVYPLWAVLAGVTFINLGGWFWGRMYLVGLLAFAAVLVMAWWPNGAPVVLGFMFTTVSAVLGLHVRGLPKKTKLQGSDTNPKR